MLTFENDIVFSADKNKNLEEVYNRVELYSNCNDKRKRKVTVRSRWRRRSVTVVVYKSWYPKWYQVFTVTSR